MSAAGSRPERSASTEWLETMFDIFVLIHRRTEPRRRPVNKLPGRKVGAGLRTAPGFVRADQLVLDHPRPEEARQLIEGHALLRPGDVRREGDFAGGLPKDVAGLRVPELQPEREDREPGPHDL